MSYGVSSEVAEDYVQALQSLTMNSRYEISNLTVIAKENTEHALAISEALKNHIKQTAPAKKLPAFYVLDSVVKNVGTPYTLFFGRQLYSTFMEAYALVDLSTRRKMDEMLKTWKEPVPGSIDVRPVFPREVTGPIENALIKARTTAVQAHQEKLRNQQQNMGRGMPGQYRPSPTPPNMGQAPPQPVIQAPPGYDTNHKQQQYPISGNQPYQSQINSGSIQGPPQHPINQTYSPQPVYQQYPPQTTQNQQYLQPQPSVNQYPQPSSGQGYAYTPATQPYPQQYPPQAAIPQHPPQSQPLYNGQPPDPRSWSHQPQQSPLMGYSGHDTGLESLKKDVSNLILSARAQWQLNPLDNTVQIRLKALLDLEKVLLSQQLPPDQISLIRNQVTQLSEAAQPPPRAVTPPPYVPPPAKTPPKATSAQPTISSLLGSGALAALLRQASATPQPVNAPKPDTVRPPSALSQSYNPTTVPVGAPAPAVAPSNPLALLEKLRASGLLSGASPVPSSTPPLPLGTLAGNGLPGFPPSSLGTPAPMRTPLGEIPNDVVLNSTSLKIFRPHLISSLYERLGLPCTSCGRRFQANEEGKKKKTAHMDWHFKINQRMIEAEKRGQHRSWYVDELDWIKSRELDEDQHPNGKGDASSGSTGSAPAKPKAQYMLVPVDSSSTNTVCPICQEKFEPTYLIDAQDFVWMDAKDYGGRVYHVSCHTEAYKDNLTAQVKRGTPEPVLGKRKAEDEHDMAVRSKIKTEPSP